MNKHPEIIDKIINHCVGDEQPWGGMGWTLKALRLVSRRYHTIVDDFLKRTKNPVKCRCGRIKINYVHDIVNLADFRLINPHKHITNTIHIHTVVIKDVHGVRNITRYMQNRIVCVKFLKIKGVDDLSFLKRDIYVEHLYLEDRISPQEILSINPYKYNTIHLDHMDIYYGRRCLYGTKSDDGYFGDIPRNVKMYIKFLSVVAGDGGSRHRQQPQVNLDFLLRKNIQIKHLQVRNILPYDYCYSTLGNTRLHFNNRFSFKTLESLQVYNVVVTGLENLTGLRSLVAKKSFIHGIPIRPFIGPLPQNSKIYEIDGKFYESTPLPSIRFADFDECDVDVNRFTGVYYFYVDAECSYHPSDFDLDSFTEARKLIFIGGKIVNGEKLRCDCNLKVCNHSAKSFRIDPNELKTLDLQQLVRLND